MKRNDEVLDLAEFTYSKFVEDPELKKRGGADIYRQWINNSFGRDDKYFALSKDVSGEINGFLLYSFVEKSCNIELIAVSNKVAKSGIGKRLFKSVEYEAYQLGCKEIRVGTQVRNTPAINFYHKCGCTQIESHQIYHLWNL